MQIMRDRNGRPYVMEIAKVRFLGGYVVWIDDEPYNEGEPFRSRDAAEQHIRHEFGASKEAPFSLSIL